MRFMCCPHRENVIILPRIVMEAFRMERVGGMADTLPFMEIVVLEKGLYPVFLHEPVIFFEP